MRANNIDEVMDIMDKIVDDCITSPNRLGYFASLYRLVTDVVRDRCRDPNKQWFNDPERMEWLDTIFANRYFDAYFAEENGEQATESWQASFEAADDDRLLILQHLLMGMNAHISLDLGIATAEVADGELTQDLIDDFMVLNNILGSLIDDVQTEVGSLSPLLKFGDQLAWRSDETFVSFSINIARDKALEFAQELVDTPRDQWDEKIKARDAEVARFSRDVLGTVRWFSWFAIWIIHLMESKDVFHNVKVMGSERWKVIAKQHIEDVLAEVERRGLDLTSRDTQTFSIKGGYREG